MLQYLNSWSRTFRNVKSVSPTLENILQKLQQKGVSTSKLSSNDDSVLSLSSELLNSTKVPEPVESNYCLISFADFKELDYKGHFQCRNCGGSYLKQYCKKFPLIHLNIFKPVRVCVSCFELIKLKYEKRLDDAIYPKFSPTTDFPNEGINMSNNIPLLTATSGPQPDTGIMNPFTFTVDSYISKNVPITSPNLQNTPSNNFIHNNSKHNADYPAYGHDNINDKTSMMPSTDENVQSMLDNNSLSTPSTAMSAAFVTATSIGAPTLPPRQSGMDWYISKATKTSLTVAEIKTIEEFAAVVESKSAYTFTSNYTEEYGQQHQHQYQYLYQHQQDSQMDQIDQVDHEDSTLQSFDMQSIINVKQRSKLVLKELCRKYDAYLNLLGMIDDIQIDYARYQEKLRLANNNNNNNNNNNMY